MIALIYFYETIGIPMERRRIMKKKSLLILMALVICLSSFMGFSVSAFSDVTAEHRHSEAITYLTDKGVIHGYEDGTFKPENDITRAEFLTLLLEFVGTTNIYGKEAVKTGFADVDLGTHNVNDAGNVYTIKNDAQHWAAGYIKIAVDKKIVSGYGNGLFKPDAPVTYEEAIKMVVCALGREGMAQTKVDTLGIPFWPDAYLSVGNDLLIAKNTEYVLGTKATRTNIAQMLYNVKDVPVIYVPTVNTSGNIVGGGGGGGGSINIVGDPTFTGGNTSTVSGKTVEGTVVAAYKTVTKESQVKIMLDDEIVIDGNPVTDFNKNYIIVKYDDEYVRDMKNETYGLFETNKVDYSKKLAHHVEIKYTDNPSYGSNGKKTIEKIVSTDTTVIPPIHSKYLKSLEQDPSGDIIIHYTDGEEDFRQSLYTNDLDTLKVVYNNKLIDVEALGDGDGIDIITMEDLMPVNGDISIVNVGDNASIELIWVNSYDTYVVGSSSFTNTKKTIYDKFRKDGNDPSPLDLYDANSQITLNIKNTDGNVLKAEDVRSPNTLLSVARSKCGTYINITKEKSNDKLTVSGSAIKENYVASGEKKYDLSKYFKDNVAPKIQYATDDTVDIYIDNNKNVIWAEVKEPIYSTGYIVNAMENTGGSSEKITVELLPSNGITKTIDINPRTCKIVIPDGYSFDCLEEKPIFNTNPTGTAYRDLSVEDIMTVLEQSAAKINTGKDSRITVSATHSQPIKYIEKNGELSTIVILKLDESNKFTNNSMKYRKQTLSGNTNYRFTYEQRDILATGSSMFIFVPNNRNDKTFYKIGSPTSSAISGKLVEYMSYNAESYYSTDIKGIRSIAAVVFYNEDIDTRPNYRSENVVVTEYETGSDEEGEYYKLTGYVGGVKKVFDLLDETVYESACVLDENFERTSTITSVGIGDVIRLGKSMEDGFYENIEIIFDISNPNTAEKKLVVDKKSNIMLPSMIEDYSEDIHYYARIGKMTGITGTSAETSTGCRITIDGTPETVLIGSGYSSKKILLYDFNITNEESRIKTDATMGELYNNEMLFLWQTWQNNELIFKQIYAVRYPESQE